MKDNLHVDDDLTIQVKAAIAKAVADTLKAGVPIFYRDSHEDMYVMEQPDGRKFEIRFIPHKPDEENYEVVRELSQSAA